MAMLPKLKLKALVSFPSNVYGGTGIEVNKANGNFTVDLDYSEFAFFGDLPPNTNVLVWDPITNVYTLVPPSATGGISDAPSDSLTYGRRNGVWVDAWASPALTGSVTAPTPAPGDNDTTVATTEFVGTAIAAIPGGTPPPDPATATPIVDGVGAVGVSLKYAREDHVHPAGAAGSGDVTGPASAAADSIAVFNGTTGKIIKDGGALISGLQPANQAVRYDAAQSLTTPQQSQARANIAVPGASVVINGDFRINQGGYVSGAGLSAGLYGHDQWKGGASGAIYSFTQLKSSTQITITAGSLIQPIEDVYVAGGSYVLTWTGTAQARAGVNTLTPSGSYVASPLLIAGQTAGTVMSIEFNSGTLGTVKLESGTIASPFIMRPLDQDLAACQRYYWKSIGTASGYPAIIGNAYAGSVVVGANVAFPVSMSFTPSLAKAGTWLVTNCGQPAPNTVSRDGFTFYVTSIAAGTVSTYPADATCVFTATARL